MTFLTLFISYCIGSLSFAIIVSKFMNLSDPRSYGSNNAGATNVMRSGNKKAAAYTLIGDLLKGTFVVLVVKSLYNSNIDGNTIAALSGVFVVIGHIYPVFFKFKGGKGVATAFGVMLGFNPILALLLAVTWIVVFKISKISSLSALIATILSPVYAFLLMGNNTYCGAVLVIAFFVLYKHKENIFRLFSGEEHKFKKKRE